jgi:hypothetical protein
MCFPEEPNPEPRRYLRLPGFECEKGSTLLVNFFMVFRNEAINIVKNCFRYIRAGWVGSHQRYMEITRFSLVLRKEYFDCPQRDSHAVHYIY